MEVRAPGVDELVVMAAAVVDDVAQQLDVVYRRVVATNALMVQRVDTVSAFAVDGHRNVTAWCRSTYNWSNADAVRFVKLARAMKALPEFQTACLAGRIGVSQMHAIAAVATNPRVTEHLAGADRLFTTSAEELPFDDLAVVLRHWEALADTDGARSRHDRAVRDRRAAVRFVGERAFLDAAGPAHDGVTFEAVLARFVDLEWQWEWDMFAAVHGEAMHAGLMERTHAQRCFDALQRIFQTAADSRQSDGTGVRTTVNIVIDQATYEHELARITGEDPAPLDPNLHATSRRCEDSNGRVLDPHHITAMTLTEHVRRIVIRKDGVVINMGRRQRLFTGAARDAVLLAHRRCTRVGCTIPSTHCEADHLHPHGHGGVTDTDNGAPACDVHNRHRNRGYRTVRDARGLYHTLRPDGTEVGWPVMRLHGRYLQQLTDLDIEFPTVGPDP